MFENFLENSKGWLNAEGPDSDIVISSRIRLARNIENYPFPVKATVSHKAEITQKIKSVYGRIKSIQDALFVDMDKVNDLDKQFLLERHLVSQEHLQLIEGKSLIVSDSEVFSLMINEEDHLRMQVIVSGFNLKEAWRLMNELDDDFSKYLVFSFLPDIGYLTSCPTNLGTGLRASCMLHLPALVLTKRINRMLELLAKLSFTTRGLFGEGTQALGNFFQISNQVSLGFSEEEIIDNLFGVVRQIKEQELRSREIILKRHQYSFEDKAWRSLGILKNCRLISTKEALSHLSMLCTGVDLGIIKGIDRRLVNNLFIIIQPAHLQKMEQKELSEKKRDYIRAAILREKLS